MKVFQRIYEQKRYDRRAVVWRLIRGYLTGEVEEALKGIKETVCEIRIRRNKPLCVTVSSREHLLKNLVTSTVIDSLCMDRIVDRLCKGSVYMQTDTMKEGFLVTGNGIRVGCVGKVICDGDEIKNLSSIDSLNIRLPLEIIGVSREIVNDIKRNEYRSSYLLYSPPAMGKTTILRDIIVELSRAERRVSVIDSRRELETDRLNGLAHVDILSGYPRGKGIEIATRIMSPQYIVCDEIGGEKETEALLSVQNCGVPIIATAHAFTLTELLNRRNIYSLYKSGSFDTYVGIEEMNYGKPPRLIFHRSGELAGLGDL